MILKFLSKESVSKASEGCIYVIKRISSYQNDHEHIRMMSYPKGFDQKGDLQKVDLHKVLHPQSLFCTIHGSFLKFKLYKTRSKRIADNFEKLVDPNGQFSSLLMYLLTEKESNLLLLPVLDQWIKKLWAQDLKSQWQDFEVYINQEDEKEEVRTLCI